MVFGANCQASNIVIGKADECQQYIKPIVQKSDFCEAQKFDYQELRSLSLDH